MQGEPTEISPSDSSTVWHPWPPKPTPEPESWRNRLRLRSFLFVLSVTTAAIVLIVGRDALASGTVPLSGAGAALCLILIQVLVVLNPAWCRPLLWAGLAILLEATFQELRPLPEMTSNPAYVFLPLLVLYGVLLGDLALNLAAVAFILLLCGLNLFCAPEISGPVVTRIVNISVATTVISLTGVGVWLQHQKLIHALARQARSLRRELETRRRLNAVIFHDIRNPLSAIVSRTQIARESGETRDGDLKAISLMATRINEIIVGVEDAHEETPFIRTVEPVPLDRIRERLAEVFCHRLRQKDLDLAWQGETDLAVNTNLPLICNSVLGNLLTNAIKFSPRGGRIEIRATREHGFARIEIQDRGPGFPPHFFRGTGPPEREDSLPGTEGEEGSGYGLGIAAFYLKRLRGRMEIRNREGGGAEAAVLLPLAP
ncbi:MAG TPA: ATP-binding protein [bacterium]|mgnify:CR=1 FL=1|nr:ATP-binding protein [bacterium]